MTQNRPDTMACGIDANRPPNLPAQRPHFFTLADTAQTSLFANFDLKTTHIDMLS